MSRHGHRTRVGCCPDGTQIVHNMCLTQDEIDDVMLSHVSLCNVRLKMDLVTMFQVS
jgi:hypothetical protein